MQNGHCLTRRPRDGAIQPQFPFLDQGQGFGICSNGCLDLSMNIFIQEKMLKMLISSKVCYLIPLYIFVNVNVVSQKVYNDYLNKIL